MHPDRIKELLELQIVPFEDLSWREIILLSEWFNLYLNFDEKVVILRKISY